MHLLSEREIKNKGNEELDRVRKIDTYLSTKTKELNIFKFEIEKQKQVLLDDFIKFKENITKERDNLNSDIGAIRKEKEKDYSFLSQLTIQANEKIRLAEELEKKLVNRESQLCTREESLKKRLESIDISERQLKDKEALINCELETLKRDQYNQELENKATTLEFGTREKNIKIKEKYIENKLFEINLGMEANKKNSSMLKEREIEFKKNIEVEKIKLSDSRSTLDRAWTEFRNKSHT